MTVYALGDRLPEICSNAYVHPDAVIIGRVTIGPQSTVWPSAVLRGDYGTIVVGARTSVQDGAVLHATEADSTVVGDECVIGHLAHLEGCSVGNGSLIGAGAVVLARAEVGEGTIVAASAFVGEGVIVPAHTLAIGVPARFREIPGGAASLIRDSAELYVKNGMRYQSDLRRLDPYEG